MFLSASILQNVPQIKVCDREFVTFLPAWSASSPVKRSTTWPLKLLIIWQKQVNNVTLPVPQAMECVFRVLFLDCLVQSYQSCCPWWWVLTSTAAMGPFWPVRRSHTLCTKWAFSPTGRRFLDQWWQKIRPASLTLVCPVDLCWTWSLQSVWMVLKTFIRQ